MAKIALRVYNHEIEGLIEANQLDEAIAHCHFILKTFPMHVDTYRLLGKAFLESRRYTDAADIFQRILMVVPDDFVSHVGMSIIRDDENKLDEAIWHMERAFEVQPSNPAIQGELRRLYGRRDGIEPPKIRLSRDALAYMYAQGDLHNQAIAEIRSVLAEDANRPDLLVMLARSYLRSGQKVQAAETAAGLLKKYPYCMDSLRILVDVLPGTAKAENTQVYRQRLVMLDPYASFVAGSAFLADQVADPAVTLEKLEYKAESAPAVSHTDWAASLGIKVGEDRKGTQPQWLSGAPPTGGQAPTTPSPTEGAETPLVSFEPIPVTPEPPPVTFATLEADSGVATIEPPPAPAPPAPEPPPAAFKPQPLVQAASPAPAPTPPPTLEPEVTSGQAGESIPDWLRAAGWQPATEAGTQPPAEISTPPSAEPLAAAEIPDWLKSMAPPEVARDLTSAGPNTMNPPAQEPQAFNEELPDWLKGALPPAAGPAAEPPVPSVVPKAATTPPTPPPTPPAAAVPPRPSPIKEEPVQPPPAIPAVPRAEPVLPVRSEAPAPEQEDSLAWLKSLAPEQPGKEEELPALSPEQAEGLPDWLRPEASGPTVAGPAEEAPAPAAPTPLPAEEQVSLPAEQIPPPVIAQPAPVPPLEESETFERIAPAPEEAPHQPEGKPLNIEDDTLAWLESLAAKQGAKPEELLTKPDQRSEALPDWLQKVVQEQPSDQIPAGLPAQPLAEPPRPPEQVAPTAVEMNAPEPTPEQPVTVPAAEEEEKKPEPASVGDDMTITSWLSKLDVEEALGKAGRGETTSVPPAEELPDWLKDLEKPAPATQPAKQAEGKPEWLSSAPEPAAPVESEAAAPQPAQTEPELPVWSDENAPVVAAPAPTSAEEWVPVEKAEPLPKPQPVTPTQPEPIAPPPVPDTQPVTVVLEKPALPPSQPAPQVPVPVAAPAKSTGQEKDAELLEAAQSALQANQLKVAVQAYAKLIKKGHLLEESIHDLREATYRFPVDIIIWQTLGDAYMRANRLQDALDAYNKAEELLR
jgi:tetratricopeptide (TPR) repeat protein